MQLSNPIRSGLALPRNLVHLYCSKAGSSAPGVFLLAPPACCWSSWDCTGVNASVAAAVFIIFWGRWGDVKFYLLSTGWSFAFAGVTARGRCFLGGRASCGSSGELPGLCGIRRLDNIRPGFSLNGQLALCGHRSDLLRRAKMNCFASQEARERGKPSPSPAVPAVSAAPCRGGSAPRESCSYEVFNGEPSFGSGSRVPPGHPAELW